MFPGQSRPATSAFRFAAGVLAAGRSSRMGHPKLLLPWGKTSVLGHLIEQWTSLGAEQVKVVCAYDDKAIAAELIRLGVSPGSRILNPTPEAGMFSSVQCAARCADWNDGLTHWALVLGDQPHLPQDVLQRILAFSVAHPELICVPHQGGHRRHPVVLPRLEWERLAEIHALDLRSYLNERAGNVALCPIEDASLALDLDRPEDYSRALKLFPPDEIKPNRCS